MTDQLLVVTRLSNPIVNEIRGLIGDFIASGLSGELGWLDIDNPNRIILQTGDGDSVMTLDDWMTDHLQSVLDLQLVVFQPLVDGFSPVTQDFLHQALAFNETLRRRLLSASSIIMPGADSTKHAEEIFLSSRVNIVVSPVDGRSPLSPTVKIDGSSERYFGHAATSLISLLGAWVGQDEFPIGSYSAAVTGVARPVFVVRTYVRHIDAAGLVGTVIENALSVTDGDFSTFDKDGIAFSKVQQHAQQGVVREVAKEFIEANQSMISLAAPAPFRPKKKAARSIAELLREYLSFMGSIVQTPGTWARTKFNEISGDFASKAQNAFLGKDSEYEIFVNGVSGLDATLDSDSVSQLVSAADSIRGSVSRPPSPNPGTLWSELSMVSSSLVDASEIGLDLQMPGVRGGARDVISKPFYLVRSGDSEIYMIPPSLPIALAGKIIKPSDPYLFVLSRSQIDEALAKTTKLSSAQQNMLQEAKVELENWGSSQSSLLWAVGEQIANGLNVARKALLPQATKVDDELDQKTLVDLEIKVRKKFLRVIFGALGIAALGGLAWLAQATYLNIITGRWPSGIISNWGLPLFAFLGMLTLWLIVSSIIFDRGMRELFALRHRRIEARLRADHTVAQRAHMLQEIMRLGEIYSQFQAWSSVLAPPILNPVHLQDQKEGGLGNIRLADLPSSFSQGRLTGDVTKVQDLSNKVRHEYFSVGWLQKTIDGYLEFAGADLARVWQESPSDARGTFSRVLENLSRSDQSTDWTQGSSARARRIATESANYGSWPLATDFGKGKVVDSSQEFMQELATGSESLPAALLTDATTVAQEGRLNTELSKIYFDNRLDLTSSISSFAYAPFANLAGRELDLMAVRIDVSNCLSPSNFSFVKKGSSASAPTIEVGEAEPEA